MAPIPAFGPWDEKTHLGDKQEKTIKRAQLSETTPQSVDRAAQTAVFFGSGKNPYQTSLSSCTCSDFTHRKLPCKHIYRLAMELGIIDLPYETGRSKGERITDQISLADSVAVIETLSDDAQRQISKFLSVTSDKVVDHSMPVLVTDEAVIAELRNCPLLEERPVAPVVLPKMRRYELHELIARAGVANPPSKNATTIATAQWVRENIPNVADYLPPCAAFSFIPSFDKVQRKAYQYLLRKYDNDLIFSASGREVWVPHGSDTPECSVTISADGVSIDTNGKNRTAYYFPDDEVTALLTKYDCNRCLNGFVPQKEHNN